MTDKQVVRGVFYEGFDLDAIEEGTPVQFLGAHVVRWESHGCYHEPKVAFRELFEGREVAALPINEDGSVGPLEPWMVKYIRDPHPDVIPDHLDKTPLAASHAIATAISQIIQATK
ncbi:MAG: hypothetical protein KAJ55_00125 [Anaerolineales bacterium]|nr:hypothetical protein [Anaerolineales bacterium]